MSERKSHGAGDQPAHVAIPDADKKREASPSNAEEPENEASGASQADSLLEQLAAATSGDKEGLLPQLPGEVSSSEKGRWEDKGEATLFKQQQPLTRLRLFMPSIVEETEEELARQEEDDEDDALGNGAAAAACVEDDNEALFDPNFLRLIIETNSIGEDPSQENSEFRQDFSDLLKILQTKLKQEDKFIKFVAGQITSLRIKEKLMVLKYIRHLVLNSDCSIDAFMAADGFAAVLNVCLQNDEMLEQLPGILVAVRHREASLRYLADEGAVGLMIKLGKKTDEGVVSRAAVAQACLVPLYQDEEKQHIDGWIESLVDAVSGGFPVAQEFSSASLCEMSADASEHSKLFQKTGIIPILRIFKPHTAPQALLWESATIANLAKNPTNFPEFLKEETLATLHEISNSVWNEVRLNAAWAFVFLSLQKAFHKQATGRWAAWVRDVLIIGICSEDGMTSNLTELFFANVTGKQALQGYEAPAVRRYLDSLHLTDDIVREQAQAFLTNLASTHPKEMIDSLLLLCSVPHDSAAARDALATLATLLSDPDTSDLAVAHEAYLPFVCLADRPDEAVQLLCARMLVKLISDQDSFLKYEELEPVAALLYLCDSNNDAVQECAFNGLWIAMEMARRNPEGLAVPVLRCCREDEPGDKLHSSYRDSVRLADGMFAKHRSRGAATNQLFGLHCLCALLYDASAAVQGRLAYKIESFTEDASNIDQMDDLCLRALACSLMALGRSVVDSVKSSVVVAFTSLVAHGTKMRASERKGSLPEYGPSNEQLFARSHIPSDRNRRAEISRGFPHARLPLDHFMAENYTQCLCEILLDTSASPILKQQCLATIRQSLNDPLVCQYLGKTDFMSRFFSAEVVASAEDPTDFYFMFCHILSHPATVGHVSNYMGILEKLLKDVKSYPSLALPLAQLLDAACFLPHVQGQRFVEQSLIPRPLLLDLLNLLGQYSTPSVVAKTDSREILRKPPSDVACESELPVPEGPGNTSQLNRRSSSLDLEDNLKDPWGRVLDDQELLNCVVEALISLYRLGVLKDVFDKEAMEKQFLPLFASSSNSAGSIVSLLSLANCLCIEPELLDCFLARPILIDIATSITEGGIEDEHLYTQTAELLRVALLHEEARDKVVANLVIVDSIFKIIRTPLYPPAQTRALFALHSILTNETILRTMAAEDFVPTLCDIALSGGSKDVQRVAAGILSTVVVRPTCRDVVLTGSSLQAVLGVVLDSTMPEVYSQVLWAISYLPLCDEFVQPLLENHVIERMKQIMNEEHVGVQTQARATVVQLSANHQLRSRFIELGFLPLLVSRTTTRDLSCCEASLHAMQTLSDTPMLSATLLDLGVEVKLQEVLHKCLQHQHKSMIPSEAEAPLKNQQLQERQQVCSVADSSWASEEASFPTEATSSLGMPRELEAVRCAALELLCQLSRHAVQGQLALLDDATVTMVIDCMAGTHIRTIEEKRSAATLLRLWAGGARTRKLFLAHKGVEVLLRLILSTEDPLVMEQLAWCLGNVAKGEGSMEVETQLAEAGAIDAILYYSNSMHEGVRNRAHWALGTLHGETLKYNTLLATRKKCIDPAISEIRSQGSGFQLKTLTGEAGDMKDSGYTAAAV
ncbi:conserved hypothetical protein [Neospora caninum Liverpool]|uniref:Vacuolar protein 8 n=1 Tax=Neospora caninum (strain Liverpool) TaxID=572307 RepID=F0VBT2_NEOCL|nr:conserved hypothetical protein [Neospora caninum Liverpool]CBZ51066.1 conserved hypothetical protein [Neospora caninum Liverpool]|eukprot:XP_003881099.1 conserved hypothetical protein [Neospora caninum Liverpool]